MSPVGVALVGYGYWGPNLARNIAASRSARLVAVCDASAERRAQAEASYLGSAMCGDLSEALAMPEVEAVFIATPVFTHHALATAALRAGRHVFVEKPIAGTAAEAWDLVALASEVDRCLMVDHTFLYTGAVRKVRELVESGEIGKLQYFDSCRVSLGLIQSDVNVLWDLAVHDLSILDFVVQRRPRWVSAVGTRHAISPQVNTAFLTLGYDDDFIAHINVNWLSPVKIRRTLIGATSKMIVFDDLEPSEKVKVYDAGYDPAADGMPSSAVRRRVGDVWIPLLDGREALAAEVDAFAAYVRGGVAPHNDGRSGAGLVEILEAANASLAQGGCPTDLPEAHS